MVIRTDECLVLKLVEYLNSSDADEEVEGVEEGEDDGDEFGN